MQMRWRIFDVSVLFDLRREILFAIFDPRKAHFVLRSRPSQDIIVRLRIFREDSSMTFDEFRQSLTATEPPAGLTHALAGLWWDAKGDWTRAHESAQQDEGVEGSWVHAYLHRKEGDQANATYWYMRAGKPVCREPLEAEWLSIVTALLE
jgi:hypothetical protein